MPSDRDDPDIYCCDCGWCIECRELPDIQPCTNCDKPVCHECRSDKGCCHYCSSYDLPKNVHFITDQDDRQKANIFLDIMVFWGHGKHYFTKITFGHKIKNQEEVNTKFNTAEDLKEYLTGFFKKLPKNRKWYIKENTEKTRKWFYKEGD